MRADVMAGEDIATGTWIDLIFERHITVDNLPSLVTTLDDVLVVHDTSFVVHGTELVFRQHLPSGKIVPELRTNRKKREVATILVDDLAEYLAIVMGRQLPTVIAWILTRPANIVGMTHRTTARVTTVVDEPLTEWALGVPTNRDGIVTPVLIPPDGVTTKPGPLTVVIAPGLRPQLYGGAFTDPLRLSPQAETILYHYVHIYRATHVGASHLAFARPSGPLVELDLEPNSLLGGVLIHTVRIWIERLPRTPVRTDKILEGLLDWIDVYPDVEPTTKTPEGIAAIVSELLAQQPVVPIVNAILGAHHVILPAEAVDALEHAEPLPLKARQLLQPPLPYTAAWFAQPLRVELDDLDRLALRSQHAEPAVPDVTTVYILGVIGVRGTNQLLWIIRTPEGFVTFLLGHAELARLGKLAWGALALATWGELKPPPRLPPAPSSSRNNKKKKPRSARPEVQITGIRSGAVLGIHHLRESPRWELPALQWQQLGDLFVLAPPG